MHLRHLWRKLADRKQTEGRRRPGASQAQRRVQAHGAGLREKAVPCTAMSTWVRGRTAEDRARDGPGDPPLPGQELTTGPRLPFPPLRLPEEEGGDSGTKGLGGPGGWIYGLL